MAILIVIAATGALCACGSSDVSRAVGARCDSDSECDERCQSGDDYPGGFCTVSCDRDDDCPSGSQCIARDSGICMLGCRIEAEDGCGFLGVGWRCESVAAVSEGEVTVCIGDL